MKKFLVLAMAATLRMAGSAFAVQRTLLPQPELTFATGQPATTNNDDSCDIGVTPAATLLLPYFEVDTAAAQGSGATALFTITNTSRYPQIAHVTIWTDWAFPVLTFNVFLTGYDVQTINLYDVIVRGVIVPSGAATTPGQPAGSSGAAPFDNTANPNFVAFGDRAVRTTCADLPTTLSHDLLIAVTTALTTGTGFKEGSANCGVLRIGNDHGTKA